MNAIELDIWELVPGDPGHMRYVEGRPAVDVFMELQQRLESTGYMPEEYFLLDSSWRDGKKIPKDAWLAIYVDYGGSEGIYMDIALRWNENVDGKSKRRTENFITGKTLGTSSSDMDRMHLIASAVRQAFHGGSVHPRYVVLGSGERMPDGMVTHLSNEEIDSLVNSLLHTRARQRAEGTPYLETERLLRRFLGSITEYMQTVGARPFELTDPDEMRLAIQENNLFVFKELLPKMPELYHELLVLTAGQPGRIAAEMTKSLLALVKDVPREMYKQAISKALWLGDVARVSMLLEGAGVCTDDVDGTLYAETIEAAMSVLSENVQGIGIATILARQATQSQLAAVNPYVLVRAVQNRADNLAYLLLHAGVDFKKCQADLYYAIAAFYKNYMFKDLESRGGDINAHDFGALQLCLRHCAVDVATTLIEYGADYAGFRASVDENRLSSKEKVFLEALDNHVALKKAKESPVNSDIESAQGSEPVTERRELD